MLKNFINRVKNLVEQNKDNKESIDVKNNDEIILKNEDLSIGEIEDTDLYGIIKEINEEKEIIIDSEINNADQSIEINATEAIVEDYISDIEEFVLNEEVAITIEDIHEKVIDDDKIINNQDLTIVEDELTQEDLEYIKEIKIKRGKGVKAIDVYTKEPQIFKTYKECSKKLKVPVEYIQENLKYGYTDYLGESIKYLSKELELDEVEYLNYLDNGKTPSQMLAYLNKKIFTTKVSEEKREEILCSEKLEPVKMHYIFECIDEEYDDYFKKYKSIIKRGGKKKIELIDKKGEVIEIFKSLDECAIFLNKEKNEIVEMLKYKDTKVGRLEIRYSLRNI